MGIVRPIFPNIDEIDGGLAEALKTGQVTNGGRWVTEFEQVLSTYLGVPTLAFNNGQTALMTMLKAACFSDARSRHGEVICPSFTFAATPHAIEWAGGRPVFADVDPMTMTLDPVDVERKLTVDTVAILGVDPYGIPCDYDALGNLAADAGVPFLVDAAASFGSRYKGRHDVPVTRIFSFHATKQFSTMEGGALASNDDELLDRARRIRNFGQGDDGDCPEVGLNGKMMEISALVGLAQFARWNRHSSYRSAAAINMRSEIMRADIPGVRAPNMPAHLDPMWLYRPIMVDAYELQMTRDEVADAMRDRGVMVRKYYSPACHLMACYKRFRETLPVTEHLASSVLALPVYNDMSMEEVTRVAWTLREACGLR